MTPPPPVRGPAVGRPRAAWPTTRRPALRSMLALAATCAVAQAAPAADARTDTEPPPQASAAPAAPDAATRLARVRVQGPYVDLRSGPGRGYPIFFAAERDEWLLIERRHTDWFKVRTARGVSGWVSRAQMRQTVTEDGVPFELADPGLDDYLNRRFDLGVGYGATAKTAFTRVWAGWRFADALSLDLNYGSVVRQHSTTSLWTASLLAEPWSDQRLSPFFGVGVGRFDDRPDRSLVNNTPTTGNLGALTLGMRYHLSGRVALRLDYSRYGAFVSDTESRTYQAGSVGLSVHF